MLFLKDNPFSSHFVLYEVTNCLINSLILYFSLYFICSLDRRNIKYGSFKTDKVMIGKRLKELRKSLKLSQQQLADDCKISQTTYSGYETGHYLITTTNLYYICKTYNISCW